MRMRILLLTLMCWASVHAMTDKPADAPKQEAVPQQGAQPATAAVPANPEPTGAAPQPTPQEQPQQALAQPAQTQPVMPQEAQPQQQQAPATPANAVPTEQTQQPPIQQPQPQPETPQQPSAQPVQAPAPAASPNTEKRGEEKAGRGPRLQAMRERVEEHKEAGQGPKKEMAQPAPEPQKVVAAPQEAEHPAPAPQKPAPPIQRPKPTSVMSKVKKEPGKEASEEQAAQERINIGEGIDTIDVESGGNWLRKRIIWEDAQAKYEKIKAILAKILESRMDYFANRSSVDRDLNMFFVDIGFAQGELEETVQDLLDSIEADRKKTQGMLDSQERDIREQLLTRKSEIEQLKTDAKSIGELDNALDDSLTQLLKQINLAASYEAQAWKRFKDIGQELNDKKAKEYYAHIEAAEKNIQDIYQYLNGPLMQYSETLISKIRQYMGSIKNRLDDIKKSGIELKKKLTEAEQAADAKQVEEEQPKPQPKKPKAWYDNFSFIWQYPLSFVNKIWDWIFSWFGKK